MRRRSRDPRWYFSFRSPYSWLAYRELVARRSELAERIEWIPFWEPDPRFQQALATSGHELPYATMSADKHRYILQDVRRLTADRDIEMVWPVDRRPRWEHSHLGYLRAAEIGVGREFAAQIYRLRWQEGKDISDPETVAVAGRRIGLSGSRLEEVVGAADDPAMRSAGLAVLQRIADDGVFGVPFFIDGFDRYWGMERLPAFAAAVIPARAGDPGVDPTPAGLLPLEASKPGPDAGHAGGCG